MDTLQQAVLHDHLVERRRKLQQTIDTAKGQAQLVELLQQVDAALERMEEGAYGICEVCREPIEDEYLRADPLVKVCLSHLTIEQQRAIERDLESASTIQGKLLPSAVMRMPGWEIVHHYEPLGIVSGDFCDVIRTDGAEDGAFFLFGDVSGKGVAASLLMAHLHAIFRSLAGTGLPLAELVGRANRLFSEGTMSMHFATLVWGRLDASGAIELCNAGHCPPVLLHAEGVTCIEGTGLPVGLFAAATYEVKRESMNPGDTLVLYTDGVTETHDARDDEYGDRRLAALLAQHRHVPLKELIALTLGDLAAFRGDIPKADDLTMMLIRRTA